MMQRLRLFAIVGWSLLLASQGAAIAQQASKGEAEKLAQVYLVQTSGWMEPFYSDKSSQFLPIINALIGATRIPNSRTIVATFNQNGQIENHQSPEAVYSGAYDQPKIDSAVQSITLPRRADRRYADSDFSGALTGAITKLLKGRPGIIWMITNNKVSPNNSQEVIANTQKFYDDLRSSEYILRIVAFPVRMPVRGQFYSERGFIIYGIGYGEAAAAALNSLIGDRQPIRQLFTSPPVRLKPLDQDPLQLHITAQSAGPAAASFEGGYLTIRGVPGDQQTRVTLTGNLVNSYYPQQVKAAELSAQANGLAGSAAPFAVSIAPNRVANLPPGSVVRNVKLDLVFPAVTRNSLFQDHAEAEGRLVIQLSNASLEMGGDFVERMKGIFGIDLITRDQGGVNPNGLPAVFFDYKKISSASTVIPVRLVYDYSPWPLIALAVIGILLLALIAYGLYRLMTPRRYTVRIGNSAVPVSLRPFEERTVQGGNGVRAKVRGSLFGQPAVDIIEAK